MIERDPLCVHNFGKVHWPSFGSGVQIGLGIGGLIMYAIVKWTIG